MRMEVSYEEEEIPTIFHNLMNGHRLRQSFSSGLTNQEFFQSVL